MSTRSGLGSSGLQLQWLGVQSLRCALVGAIATSTLVLAAPARADQRDFVLMNDSSQSLHSLYVSSVDTDDWEEDVLGDDVLEAGDKVKINFEAGVSGKCQYDILVVTEAKAEIEAHDINLCQAKEVVFDGETLSAQ